jgi:hypothetical protein
MPAGRPLSNTPESVKQGLDKYFASNKFLTWSGTILAAGFNSRESWREYEKRLEFVDLLKSARLKLTEFEEKQGSESRNQSYWIFRLKQHGWTDVQQIEHTGSVNNIIRFPLKSEIGTPIDGVDTDNKTGAGNQSQRT